MNRNNKSRSVLLIALLALAGLLPLAPQELFAQGAAPVITPLAKYSDPSWKGLASKYDANLNRLLQAHVRKYKHDQIHFLTVQESAVGGIGFWASPAAYGDPNRYLCLFARVRCPEPCTGRAFPDTQTGRIMTIMDAFGKFSISQLANELKAMPEQKIKGAALIFIYDRKDVNDPTFEQKAEAMALFIPRDAIIQFAELRMTIQTLFSKSQMLPVFQGGEQIKNLRQFIIQP